jgi:ATP-dependent helicase/nuclease subunit B
MPSAPNIFTVPPGQAFLDALAAAILRGDLPAADGRPPELIDLPRITLMLPTRRATRALQEAFLRASGGRAMLLPKILAIAEGQEDLTLLSGIASLDNLGTGADAIPPAVSNMERLLVLTQLVMRWSELLRAAKTDPIQSMEAYSAAGASTPAQAAHLAAELAKLMDMIETEGVSLATLHDLVPQEFSEHWEHTLDFVRIVTDFWPVHLRERRYLSPAGRRNALLLAEATRLATHAPPGPVIVAGVTGSIPATVQLMRAVAAMPQGAIVLPGLDLALDDASWDAIAPADPRAPGHPEHPQYGLKHLIENIGLTRAGVSVLPGAEPGAAAQARLSLITETMRPAGTTQRWHGYIASARADPGRLVTALDGLSLIEAPTQQDEAEAIALILREAVETPGRTAALVSPDRLLARRVALRLKAWGINVDDSAGRPFAKTVPGAFLDLVIDAVARDFAPPELMALLKHPLTRLGLDPFAVRRAGRALELAAFRTAYLGRGLDGVEQALERAHSDMRTRAARANAAEAPDTEANVARYRHPAVRRLFDEDWHGARDLVARLRAAMAPLTGACALAGPQPLRVFAAAHLAAAEAIARPPEASAANAGASPPPASPLWSGEAGVAALAFFTGLLDPNMASPEIASADYADLYRGLVSRENVRPRVPVHPRLSIWGPFEARLQQTDVMILGSLNDNTWPEPADPGPWLNRPMRKQLRLPSPEESIGHAAHDFSSFLAAPRVILTRAEKVEGVPTVPSRWLLRLKALLDGMDATARLAPDQPWLAWARQRDAVAPMPPITAPEPRPPVSMRPRRMSVSRVETFIANPYAVFARDILKLEPMEELGAAPGASLRGSIIHEALSRFAQKYPASLPSNIEAHLYTIAQAVFSEYAANARVAAFWLPRFERFARWFAETEPARRNGVEAIVAETSGTILLNPPAGPFILTARADRIDRHGNGLVITDYKTGAAPSDSRVKAGEAPQLPLEAAIAAAGGFPGLPSSLPVTALRYIRASGAEPPGEERTVNASDVAVLAHQTRAGLERFIAEFDKPETPYKALRRSRFTYDYDDYAHLARVAEWAAPSEDGEAAE